MASYESSIQVCPGFNIVQPHSSRSSLCWFIFKFTFKNLQCIISARSSKNMSCLGTIKYACGLIAEGVHGCTVHTSVQFTRPDGFLWGFGLLERLGWPIRVNFGVLPNRNDARAFRRTERPTTLLPYRNPRIHTYNNQHKWKKCWTLNTLLRGKEIAWA